MKKWIIRLVLAAVVLLIIAVAALSYNLSSLVKNAINTYGPQVTKVGTSVDSVFLRPLAGKARIGGLFVGNPSGYSSPSAITVGGVSISIDTGTVTADKIVINSININNPVITLEGGLKKNNLTAILSNIESSTAGKSGGSSEKDAGATKKLQIDSLSITGATVVLALPVLKGQTASVPLDDIHLSNLGQGPGGVTAAEVSSQIIDQILAQTTVLIPKILAGNALDGLELSGDLAKGAAALGLDLGKTGASGTGNAADGAAKGAAKGTEQITKGIGGLLKGLNKK